MFLDCTSVIAANPPAGYAGVAVADLDGDDEPEVFVCGTPGPSRVLKWTGTALRDVTPPELAAPAAGAAAADLDGDGREELYVLAAGPVPDRLFARPPGGGWADLFTRPGRPAARPQVAGRAAAALDRRGTGRYGFAVVTAGRPLRLFELSPDGALSDLAPALGVDLAGIGHGLLAAPIAGDRPDLLCLNARGPNFLFRNTGVGTFLELAAEYRLDDPAESSLAGVVAGAGVCVGTEDGPHRLMARQADGTFRDRATPALALPSAVRAVVAADFDNDGYEELFFLNSGEPNRLFRARPGEGGAGWALDDPGVATEPDGPGTGAAVADLDGDGRLELLLTHAGGSGPPLTLYKWPRTGNAWLRVRPLTRFGAPARGAVVRLTAGGRDQVRVIDGGGSPGQAEPVAHFGLGRDPVVNGVTVTWPDGATAALDHPHPLRTVTVPYPGS